MGQSVLVADGLFTFTGESATLSSIDVVFTRDILSIETVTVVDEQGKDILRLRRSGDSGVQRRTWRDYVSPDAAPYLFQPGKPVRLFVKVQLRAAGVGGVEGELLAVERLLVKAQGVTTSTLISLFADDAHFPPHHIVQGSIAAVHNMLADASISAKPATKIAQWALSGAGLSGTVQRIDGLTVLIRAQGGVMLSNLRLGAGNQPTLSVCGVQQGDVLEVACDGIAQGTLPTTLSLFADVTLASGATNAWLQAQFGPAGSPFVIGPLRWNDGSRDFNWIDNAAPLEAGPLLMVR